MKRCAQWERTHTCSVSRCAQRAEYHRGQSVRQKCNRGRARESCERVKRAATGTEL